MNITKLHVAPERVGNQGNLLRAISHVRTDCIYFRRGLGGQRKRLGDFIRIRHPDHISLTAFMFNHMSHEQEVSKEEFKKMYFKYADGIGWTESYWNHFYENEKEAKFFFTAPESSLDNRMFIISGQGVNRMVFLTEEGEDSFFNEGHDSCV